MILRSRALVPVCRPPVEDGVVVVEGGRVVAAGPFADLRPHLSGPMLDLGDRVLLPGLINAHCHLDYTLLRRAISPPRSFAKWIQRLNALKRNLEREDYVASIRSGFAELMRWGTTTVCNIESFPEVLLELGAPPIRTWWFYEMIDLRHRLTTDETIAGALAFFSQPDGWAGGFGLSPHAPYTASVELYRHSLAAGRALGMPMATHVAESAEEDWMFRDRAGELYAFMAKLGRDMGDCAGRSAFWNLANAGCLTPETILIHLNELGDDDLALIAGPIFEGRIQVVHCPQSHAYFAHRPFRFRELKAGGAKISLGTDSLASGDSLSLFEEMRRVRDAQSWLRPEEILETVTVNPASALGLEGRLGAIAPGAFADLISLPFAGTLRSVCDEIIAHAAPVDWMMINGELKKS